jgi:hypothetical protein
MVLLVQPDLLEVQLDQLEIQALRVLQEISVRQVRQGLQAIPVLLELMVRQAQLVLLVDLPVQQVM